MKILIIGGPRHGEFVEVLDGVRMWVDLTAGDSYVIRRTTASVTDPATGAVKEAYVLHLAVHPGLTGPQEPKMVSKLYTDLCMNAYARAHGEALEIPKEPAGSSLIVPENGTPQTP